LKLFVLNKYWEITFLEAYSIIVIYIDKREKFNSRNMD